MPIARVALVLFALLAIAAPASARSVRDPDIGWPEELRREQRLERPATRACNRDITNSTRGSTTTATR
jgi:hypothetical protein